MISQSPADGSTSLAPKLERILPGDIVTCPKCGRHMLRCKETPEQGSKSYPECFEDIGWGGKVGKHTECPNDGVAWCTMHPFWAIHVEGKGWISG